MKKFPKAQLKNTYTTMQLYSNFWAQINFCSKIQGPSRWSGSEQFYGPMMMSRICLFELCKGIILVAKSNWGVSPQRLQYWSGAQNYVVYLLAAAPIFVGHCHQTISILSLIWKKMRLIHYIIMQMIWRRGSNLRTKRCQFSRIENEMCNVFSY